MFHSLAIHDEIVVNSRGQSERGAKVIRRSKLEKSKEKNIFDRKNNKFY